MSGSPWRQLGKQTIQSKAHLLVALCKFVIDIEHLFLPHAPIHYLADLSPGQFASQKKAQRPAMSPKSEKFHRGAAADWMCMPMQSDSASHAVCMACQHNHMPGCRCTAKWLKADVLTSASLFALVQWLRRRSSVRAELWKARYRHTTGPCFRFCASPCARILGENCQACKVPRCLESISFAVVADAVAQQT